MITDLSEIRNICEKYGITFEIRSKLLIIRKDDYLFDDWITLNCIIPFSEFNKKGLKAVVDEFMVKWEKKMKKTRGDDYGE